MKSAGDLKMKPTRKRGRFFCLKMPKNIIKNAIYSFWTKNKSYILRKTLIILIDFLHSSMFFFVKTAQKYEQKFISSFPKNIKNSLAIRENLRYNMIVGKSG